MLCFFIHAMCCLLRVMNNYGGNMPVQTSRLLLHEKQELLGFWFGSLNLSAYRWQPFHIIQ